MSMKSSSPKGRRVRLVLFVCALALICVAVGLAVFRTPPWIVPLPDKARQNPLPLTEGNINAAKAIYSDKCANCHGDTGKGDGSDAMMYDPPPADLTDAAKMSKVTDGEIFYQISEGRKPMPSFKKKLTEEQRWQLVLLVRSFAVAPSTRPPAAQPDVPGTKQPEHPSKPK
jgi:mono/diheme cytochrome c family protein